MDGTSDKAYLVYTGYVRNFRAVQVMWGIFTMCFVVINIIVFVQPQWIGDTNESLGVGYFGLYKFCELGGHDLYCEGDLGSFDTIINTPFKVATVFIGISAILAMLCVLCLLLFIPMKASYAFIICGCIQLLSGICMFLGCVIYPLGWNDANVRRICGSDANQYTVDSCRVRWAYILAIIGIFNVLALAFLAFVLAGRMAHRPLSLRAPSADIYETKSEPYVLIAPRPLAVPADAGSQYSAHSRRSASTAGKRGDFAL